MMMYDDFIRRVHKHRTNPNLSMQIQKCVDYIEMNLDKKIDALLPDRAAVGTELCQQ